MPCPRYRPVRGGCAWSGAASRQTAAAAGVGCDIILVRLGCPACPNLFSDSFCSFNPPITRTQTIIDRWHGLCRGVSARGTCCVPAARWLPAGTSWCLCPGAAGREQLLLGQPQNVSAQASSSWPPAFGGFSCWGLGLTAALQPWFCRLLLQGAASAQPGPWWALRCLCARLCASESLLKRLLVEWGVLKTVCIFSVFSLLPVLPLDGEQHCVRSLQVRNIPLVFWNWLLSAETIRFFCGFV